MSNLLSWHKPGQKVTPIETDLPFLDHWKGGLAPVSLETGKVYTVVDVAPWMGRIYLVLEGMGRYGWDSLDLRPVYPKAVDEILSLCTPIKELEPA